MDLPVPHDDLQKRIALSASRNAAESVLTRLGVFAGEPQANRAAQRQAAHMRSTPIAAMKAATSSANNSVE
jgi:hypothetical protein